MFKTIFSLNKGNIINKTLFLSALILFLILPGESKSSIKPQPLTIYALRFADDSLYPPNHVHPNSNHKKTIPIAWLVYLALLDDKKILIDTGFYDEHFRHIYGIKHFHKIEDTLASLGLTTDNIQWCPNITRIIPTGYRF